MPRKPRLHHLSIDLGTESDASLRSEHNPLQDSHLCSADLSTTPEAVPSPSFIWVSACDLRSRSS